MALVAGIDEAGRGPVIGPMVMCGVLVKDIDEQKLKAIGAKDSKLLTPRTREILFDQIISMVQKYEVVIIPASEIDNALNDPNLNLNKLEAIVSAKIINKLKPDKVLIDCPSNNTKAYAAELRKYIGNQAVKIVAEHKADVKYTVVSAASIIAKVTRDREIEKLKKQIGADFGSGYPADEKTARFLEQNWDKCPQIFRTTWASYRKYSSVKKQKKLGEF